MILITLIIALFLFGAVIGALLVLVIGIHTTERRTGLSGASGLHSRTEIATQRVLSVHVRDGSKE